MTIPCPFDEKIICGVYHDLEDWDEWGDEKFCKRNCEYGKDKSGRRRRAAAAKSFVRQDPRYRRKVYGRKVA